MTKRPRTFNDQVDISSDESSSSNADDEESIGKPLVNNVGIDQPAKEIVSEDPLMRRAKMYQEYMKEIPLPKRCGSTLPFTSWTGLAKSIKELYGQPLHYLTNIHVKRLDQLRMDPGNEHERLEMIIHPIKAEISIWIIEEVHRFTTSHHHLAKLWWADPLYHTYIDPIFPQLKDRP